MVSATMFEAKSNLSKLVEKAEAGEEVVITRGREKKPVAKIVPIVEKPKQRLGLLKGKISIGPEFFESLPDDELRLWNCEDD